MKRKPLKSISLAKTESENEKYKQDEDTEIESESDSNSPVKVSENKELNRRELKKSKEKVPEKNVPPKKREKAAENSSVIYQKLCFICKWISKAMIILAIIILPMAAEKFYDQNPATKIKKLNNFINSSKDRFNEDSLATLMLAVDEFIKPSNVLPYFVTLFGNDSNKLHSVADQISDIFAAYDPECKIQIDRSFEITNLTTTIDSCIYRNPRWPIQIRNINLLTGDTSMVLLRYFDDSEPAHKPALYLATFTTESPFTNHQSVVHFAKDNFELIFRDVNVDQSTKVINRLLRYVAVLDR